MNALHVPDAVIGSGAGASLRRRQSKAVRRGIITCLLCSIPCAPVLCSAWIPGLADLSFGGVGVACAGSNSVPRLRLAANGTTGGHAGRLGLFVDGAWPG